MLRILIITLWEFLRYAGSKRFLLATFISPLIFAGILLLPSLFYQQNETDQPQVIGYVEFDSSGYYDLLVERLIDSLNVISMAPQVKLIKIEADTSAELAENFRERARVRLELDSLDDAYNRIKEKRRYIFQQPPSPSRDRRLKITYAQLHAAREGRDLAVIEYNRIKALTDSAIRAEVIRKADSLLTAKAILGYVVIEPQLIKEGAIEFHSQLPINFLRIDRLKQAFQVLLVEERMREEGVTSSKIYQWLKPLQIKEYRLEGGEKRQFDVMITYMGPIIVMLFLFISIFTSSGFLFNGVIMEKSNRIIELLLSTVNSFQLISGKIIGMGLLGLTQIFIWMMLTVILISTGILPTDEIGFLTLRNAGIFILYFLLGYLFFASVFTGIGSLFSTEEEAHHLSQFMRILSIFPIVLAILVLEYPNSLIVRILSFIPFLTPTFMVLRTPLGNPLAIDYSISVIVMLASTAISFLFAGKIFKMGSLQYGKKFKFKEVLRFLRE